jgi:RHS repeat-associated protein
VRNGSHPRHRFSICAICGLETHTGLGFAEAGTPTSAGGGYVYLRNRWYDPQTGRFLSQDPIGLAGGVNLYAYAGNNPASFSDPFGLCPPEWMCMAMRAAANFAINHPKAAEWVDGFVSTLFDPKTWANNARAINSSGAMSGLGVMMMGNPAAPLAATEAQTAAAVKSTVLPSAAAFSGKTVGEARAMVPEGWVESPARTGRGARFANPTVRGEQVRIMDGNPGDPNPIKRGPYVRISKDGKVSDPIPLSGD